jgi:endoglucanase
VLKSGASGASGSSSTACAVTATKTADSGGTFSESLTIKNTGTGAVTGWKLGFAFPGNQRIASGSNATYHQLGAAVLAHPVSGDTTIVAGASVTIGYTATYTGSNTAPAWYALNGVRCTL